MHFSNPHYIPKLQPVGKTLFIIFIYTLVCVLCSCNKKPELSQSPLYDSLFNAIEQAPRLEAARLLDSLSQLISQNPPGEQYQLKYLDRKFNSFYENSIYDSAMVYADSMIAVSAPLSGNEYFRKYYELAHYQKGDIYVKLLDYDEALNYFVKAKTISVKSNDTCLFDYYNRIANLYFNLERFFSAAYFYKYTFREAQRCLPDSFMSFAYSQSMLVNTALCYRNTKFQDSAVHYYLNALDYINENKNRFPHKTHYINEALANLNINYGILLMKNGDTVNAFARLRESVEISKGMPDMHIYALFSLADAHIIVGAADSAYFYLNAGKILFPAEYAVNRKSVMGNRIYQELYNLQGNKLESYKNGMQRLYGVENLWNAAVEAPNWDFEKEVNAKVQRIVNLEVEQNNQIRKQWLIFIICAAVTVAGILCFLILKFRDNRKHANEILSLNKEVTTKNAELQKKQQVLENKVHAMNEVSGVLASNLNRRNLLEKLISSDFRSHLHAIANSSEKLSSETVSKFEEQMVLMKVAVRSCFDLIDELVEKGKTASKTKEYQDLNVVLQQCVNLLQTRAEEKDQMLKINSETILLSFNRENIFRVINNLLNNAIKFSPDNSIIDITSELLDSKVRISVKDQGIGIPEHIKPILFTEQKQKMRRGTAGEESSGLGLSICKRIINDHQGIIDFKSNEGKGTTFYFELPLS